MPQFLKDPYPIVVNIQYDYRIKGVEQKLDDIVKNFDVLYHGEKKKIYGYISLQFRELKDAMTFANLVKGNIIEDNPYNKKILKLALGNQGEIYANLHTMYGLSKDNPILKDLWHEVLGVFS